MLLFGQVRSGTLRFEWIVLSAAFIHHNELSLLSGIEKTPPTKDLVRGVYYALPPWFNLWLPSRSSMTSNKVPAYNDANRADLLNHFNLPAPESVIHRITFSRLAPTAGSL